MLFERILLFFLLELMLFEWISNVFVIPERIFCDFNVCGEEFYDAGKFGKDFDDFGWDLL